MRSRPTARRIAALLLLMLLCQFSAGAGAHHLAGGPDLVQDSAPPAASEHHPGHAAHAAHTAHPASGDAPADGAPAAHPDHACPICAGACCPAIPYAAAAASAVFQAMWPQAIAMHAAPSAPVSSLYRPPTSA